MLDYKDMQSNNIKNKKKKISLSSLANISKITFGVLFLACVLLALIYGYNQFSYKFTVLKNIYVSGNKFLKTSEIVSSVGKIGKPLDKYRENSIYLNLISNPWIMSAKLSKVYPDTIVIRVKEKCPEALLYTPKGVFVIDSAGSIITMYNSTLKLPQYLEKIKINQLNLLRNRELIKSVINFYEKLDKIAKINYIEIVSNGYQVAHLANGLSVGIDSLNCPSGALQRLKESLSYLLSMKSKIASVSICFNNKFVVKRKKGVEK